MLTTTHFTPHLNTPFTIQLNDTESTSLTLISVSEPKQHLAPPGAGRAPFSPLFHAAHTRGHLPQQTWRLEHDILGVLDIFLVPLGPDATGMIYEAIFN